MASQDNKRNPHSSLLKSFSFALSGIFSAVKQERNIRIHLCATIVVSAMAIYFSATATEWICLLLTIGVVISLELVNSSLERVVDLVTEEYHPLAKQAKDMAAGAVFLFSMLAVIIGAIIFLPKFVHIFLG